MNDWPAPTVDAPVAVAETPAADPPSGPPAPTPGQSAAQLVALIALIAVAGFVWPWIMLAIAALALMIFLHELGHFVTAKRAGMKVTEFFLFFGPTVWSFTRGETTYGIKSIPIGAYVKVIGMNNLDANVDPAEESRTYRQATYPRRVLMASAGSLMHFLLALVLGVWLIAGYGEFRADSWMVGSVQPGRPAAAAGLLPGDRIVTVNGAPSGAYDDFRTLLRSSPGGTFTFGVDRGGQHLDLTATLDTCPGPIGYLGIGPELVPVTRSLPSAVARSASVLVHGIGSTAVGLGKLFSPTGIRGYVDTVANKPITSSATATSCPVAAGTDQRPSSIIGITSGVADAAKHGLGDFLSAAVGINIAIGVFNLFPMLPFDGGHIAVATYERIRQGRSRKRYHADVAKLMPVVYGLIALMLLLFVSASYLDVTRGN